MDFNESAGSTGPSRQRFSGAFLIFMAIFTVLAWQVARPLLTALIWAAMLSFVVTPTYNRISAVFRDKFPSLSAALTLLLLGLLFLLPLSVVFTTLGSELVGIVRNIYFFIERFELHSTQNPKLLIPAWTPLWYWLAGRLIDKPHRLSPSPIKGDGLDAALVLANRA